MAADSPLLVRRHCEEKKITKALNVYSQLSISRNCSSSSHQEDNCYWCCACFQKPYFLVVEQSLYLCCDDVFRYLNTLLEGIWGKYRSTVKMCFFLFLFCFYFFIPKLSKEGELSLYSIFCSSTIPLSAISWCSWG